MKRAYETPKLVVRGDVRALTQGSGLLGNDDTAYIWGFPVEYGELS